MPIPLHEELLSLAQAASLLPRRRAGKRPHPATLYRWASRGINSVRLEVLRVGATLCTSREALQRFFERLTAADERLASAHRSSSHAGEEESEVEKELDRIGL